MQKQPTELQWCGPVLVLNAHSDVRTEPDVWADDLIIRSHAPERPRRKERLEKLCQMISPTGVRRIEAESACLSPMKFSTGPTNSMDRLSEAVRNVGHSADAVERELKRLAQKASREDSRAKLCARRSGDSAQVERGIPQSSGLERGVHLPHAVPLRQATRACTH